MSAIAQGGSDERLATMAAQLRVDSIRCTTEAGSGHPTSCMSAADLMAVLLAKYLKYDWANPRHPNNDRLIFSKGHACPLLYAMFKVAGVITDGELLRLRKFGSRLQGHGPVKWKQFQVRYRKELREKKDALKLLKQKSKEHTVTLVHGARNEEHNEALVLKRILDGRRTKVEE